MSSGVTTAAKDASEPVLPFTVLGPGDVKDLGEPVEPPIFYDIMDEPILRQGMTAAIIGPGGCGKSRWVLNLAVANCTGRNFLAFKQGDPLKWLIVGNENSKTRWWRDVNAIFSSVPKDKHAGLKRRLMIQFPETEEDLFINLLEEYKTHQCEKWKATIEAHKPDVVVIDPFEALLGGDPNDADLVRQTITTLRSIVGLQCTIILVHHARSSRADIRMATGWDRGNYVKGSKSFATICRLIVNIAPGDSEDPGKILVSCGKINDTRGFEPFGAKLKDDGFNYVIDEDFDLEAWENDVEGKRSKSLISPAQAANAVKATDGTRKALKDHFAYLACSDKTIDRALRGAESADLIYKIKNGVWAYCDQGNGTTANSGGPLFKEPNGKMDTPPVHVPSPTIDNREDKVDMDTAPLGLCPPVYGGES